MPPPYAAQREPPMAAELDDAAPLRLVFRDAAHITPPRVFAARYDLRLSPFSLMMRRFDV